jgi:hypothetical protein
MGQGGCSFKIQLEGQVWWFKSIIPATWEVEIRRLQLKPDQAKVSETLFL